MQIVEDIIRESEALFGYVYEIAPEGGSFARGRPIAGTETDEKIFFKFYKETGERALNLLKNGWDQAIPIVRQGTSDVTTQFAVIKTQDLGAPACVAIYYSFYDKQEAIRTLRLVEMILTTRPLL